MNAGLTQAWIDRATEDLAVARLVRQAPLATVLEVIGKAQSLLAV